MKPETRSAMGGSGEDAFWGLLGPEMLHSERRTRTLGLGAAVRSFNDLAVPGLGGVWFGKQLLLATLGVAVAVRLRADGYKVQNIETANAIEALACRLALSQNQWQRDARVRGALKLRGKDDLSFAAVRKRTFYVTQPMRMTTIQPLLALGLVESTAERFNAFRCSAVGEQFIAESCSPYSPYNRAVLEHLIEWASGRHHNVAASDPLRKALSPLEPLPTRARDFLRDLLVRGNGSDGLRRRSAVKWMDALRDSQHASVSWEVRPDTISDDHWHDLHVAALFFATRDAAIALLIQLEQQLGNCSDSRLALAYPLVSSLGGELHALRQHAYAFLRENYDPSPDRLARTFCKECTAGDDAALIGNLVNRDERVLRLRDGVIRPGPAFRGGQGQSADASRSAEESDNEITLKQQVEWPEGISHRVQNLFMLNIDLYGELSGWLDAARSASEGDHENG
jgi:hypothetical protein